MTRFDPRGHTVHTHTHTKVTLCGVSVIEQLGLTVGQDLNLRRIWTLANTGRHESVQILEARHLKHTSTFSHRKNKLQKRFCLKAECYRNPYDICFSSVFKLVCTDDFKVDAEF